MKTCLDTSVFVAALVKNHPHHAPASAWLKKAIEGEYPSFVSAHTLAETYAVLTRLPLSPKISGLQANELIKKNILEHAKVIDLTHKDYANLIEQVATQDLTGGVVYDAITFASAEKAKVERLVTFNAKDFLRLHNPSGIEIRSA